MQTGRLLQKQNPFLKAKHKTFYTIELVIKYLTYAPNMPSSLRQLLILRGASRRSRQFCTGQGQILSIRIQAVLSVLSFTPSRTWQISDPQMLLPRNAQYQNNFHLQSPPKAVEVKEDRNYATYRLTYRDFTCDLACCTYPTIKAFSSLSCSAILFTLALLSLYSFDQEA